MFNNPSLLPCDLSILDEIENSPELLNQAEEPSLDEVSAAIKHMANGKATGPLGLLQDALKAMIFVDAELNSQDSAFLTNYVHEILISFWRGKKILTNGIMVPYHQYQKKVTYQIQTNGVQYANFN
eukprot:12469618-Ditylum_brightwellii.AAC.1